MMTNKELFYFTGKCLALDEHPYFRNEIIHYTDDDSINWNHFIELCSNHLILPAIYLKFQTHEILPHVPNELSIFLADIFELNKKRNEEILMQLQKILAILNTHKIYPTILKGVGNLIDDLYSDNGERILGDIDILVPEENYLLAANLMKDNGYCTFNPIPAYENIKTMKHYPRLIHPEFPAALEIHRIPVRDNYLKWFNTSIIDKEKTEAHTFGGCFVESDNHKIIHNFIHSQLSNRGHLSGIVSFRDLYDLYLLSKRSDLKESIVEIKTKQKAITYFVFAGRALGVEDKFCFKGNINSWVFSKKHTLNLTSTFFYRFYKNLLFFEERIFRKYIYQIINSIYSVEIRQSLHNRLKDRNWYKTHFRLYKNYFFPNK